MKCFVKAKRAFNRFIRYVRRYWLIASFIFIFFISIGLYFIGFQEEINNISEILMKIITPYTVALGVILGYPLLKRRLMEKYIAKRFEMITDANNSVRRECLKIEVKYPVKSISEPLTTQHIEEALSDMIVLRQSAIDANPEVYKYVDLVYQAINRFYERFKDSDNSPNCYKEPFDSWLHAQIHQIYDCSKSNISFPNGEFYTKRRLNKKLSKYVTENNTIEIKELDTSISHYHTSALLVRFYEINNITIPEDNYKLFSDCFKGAISPSPLVRIMYNSEIYIPPILRTPDKILFNYGYLHLIGFKRKGKIILDNGKSKSSYVCIYHNLSDISFVIGTISNKNDLNDFIDCYLDLPFNIDNITKFEKYGEYIILTIDVEYLTSAFYYRKSLIIDKFQEELSKNSR